MHAVGQVRLGVGHAQQVERAGVVPQLQPEGVEQLVAVDRERLLARPDPLHDLEARIVAPGLDAEQRAPAPQRPRQRGQDAADLELGRHAGPPGLRRQDQVVVGPPLVRSGQHLVEGERLVGPVDHQHRRGDVERVARLLAGLDVPVAGQEVVEAPQLLVEPVGRRAAELHGVVHQPGPLGLGVGCQVGGLGVVEVGQHHHRLGVLDEPVGELAQREAHVLQADLLAHDVQGHGGELGVDRAEQVRQHGAVAHAGVEQAKGRRLGGQCAQLPGGPLGHGPLLVARRDEREVLLAVVVEAERSGVAAWPGKLSVVIHDAKGSAERPGVPWGPGRHGRT